MRGRKHAMATEKVDVDPEWRARCDLRTLSEAAEISVDKARVRAARAEAQRQMTALQRVASKGGDKKKSRSNSAAARRRRLSSVEL